MSTSLSTLTLSQLAEKLRITRFRPEGMIFRRVDANLVSHIEKTASYEMEVKRWEYPVRDIQLQQIISVYDLDTKTTQQVEIKVEDRSNPINDVNGNTIGYHPMYYGIQERGINERGGHFHTNQFIVRDELVYYYLMLCEYNAKNTVENRRRRSSSPIPVHFELYDPKWELQQKREAEKERNRAIVEIGKLNEAGLVSLCMRYGVPVNYPDGTFMDVDDMSYMLQSLIGATTDLSKGANSTVTAEKVIKDTSKKTMESTLRVAACVRKGVLQFSPADGVWHHCTHNGRSYVKSRALCTRSASHSDSYEAIIAHLEATPSDMSLLSTVPPIKGHDRIETEPPLGQPEEAAAPIAHTDGEPQLAEGEKLRRIKDIIADHGIAPPHFKSGHAKVLEYAKANGIDIPAHLR